MSPTQAQYIDFLRNVVGIDSTILPDASPAIGWSYNIALAWVNKALKAICGPSSPYASTYAIAVYNLATDRLLNFAPDLPGSPDIPGSDPPMKFFAYTRKQLNIGGFVAGVVQSTNDEGTGVGFVVPKQFENFTVGDLQNLKTPYGQQYLAIAQMYGPSVWGLTR